MGAVAVSLINIITASIGPGWTYTLGGALCLFTWPLVEVVLHMGPRWRRRRQERAKAAEKEQEEAKR